MKKKYLLFIALVAILGSVVSGCVIDRGYHHPYYHHHEHHWHGGWN
ncbi:MAG TPA: hypothetical protein VG847_12340 [Chitinophagaceae bacterium]|nr:hypothetical protein [Chitinophagaceae bacterium]